MLEDLAFHALVVCCGKTEFHGDASLGCFVYMHIITQGEQKPIEFLNIFCVGIFAAAYGALRDNKSQETKDRKKETHCVAKFCG